MYITYKKIEESLNVYIEPYSGRQSFLPDKIA